MFHQVQVLPLTIFHQAIHQLIWKIVAIISLSVEPPMIMQPLPVHIVWLYDNLYHFKWTLNYTSISDHFIDITAYSYNSKGRYYKHSTRDVFYYYDRRYKKWVMSDAMNDKEAFGYLDESTECPNMTKLSPLMAKGSGQKR